jgi:hypothetical protein
VLIRIWQEAVEPLPGGQRACGWGHPQRHAKSQLIVLIRIWLEADTLWLEASQIADQFADLHLAGGCGNFGPVFAEPWLGTSSATRQIAAHCADTHVAGRCARKTLNHLKHALGQPNRSPLC